MTRIYPFLCCFLNAGGKRVTITNTGQRNHQPNCAAFCVLLMVKGRAVYMCARCDVGLCVVPCFVEYHTKINL